MYTCLRAQGHRDALYMTLIKTCFSFKIFHERDGNPGLRMSKGWLQLGNKENEAESESERGADKIKCI